MGVSGSGVADLSEDIQNRAAVTRIYFLQVSCSFLLLFSKLCSVQFEYLTMNFVCSARVRQVWCGGEHTLLRGPGERLYQLGACGLGFDHESGAAATDQGIHQPGRQPRKRGSQEVHDVSADHG